MSRWPISTSLIFTAVTNEFRPSHPPLLTLSQNIGLLFGAVFWGFGCDIFGRRWAFNLTIGITSVFGLVAAGSPKEVNCPQKIYPSKPAGEHLTKKHFIF